MDISNKRKAKIIVIPWINGNRLTPFTIEPTKNESKSGEGQANIKSLPNNTTDVEVIFKNVNKAAKVKIFHEDTVLLTYGIKSKRTIGIFKRDVTIAFPIGTKTELEIEGTKNLSVEDGEYPPFLPNPYDLYD